MTFEELASMCNASVSLSANDYCDSYQTLTEWLETCNHDVSAERIAELQAAPNVYALSFYPDTPIGSYCVLGTSVEECLAEAGRIMREHRGDDPPPNSAGNANDEGHSAKKGW